MWNVQQNKDGEQESFSLFGRFSLFILLAAFSYANAGDFEDFKEVQNAAFSEFKDKKDTQFDEYLKSQWSEYKTFISPKLFVKPKPKVIAPAPQESIAPLGPNIHLKLIRPPKAKPIKIAQETKGLSVSFFGTSLYFTIDSNLKKARFYPQNKDGIINSFSVFAASDTATLLEEIKTVSQTMVLNDWGIYLLVQKISGNVFYDFDDRKLFMWFVLNKLGYDTKVALSDEHIVLLSLTKQTLYATPAYNIKSKKYYFLSKEFTPRAVYTYEQNYPNAHKALDFTLSKLPHFMQKREKKHRTFTFNAKRYEVNYSYNKNLVDFMGTYPQVNYSVYFNAPLEAQTLRDIEQSFKPYLDGKKMNFGINFLLRFVQSAFGYERDQDQFGKEKVMFAQETLFYDKSDCEDRATLYARLVKEFFGISVVGVKYKNHMATALYIPLKGVDVKVHSRRYVIADPTYINANVGEAMPKYRSTIPESFIYLNQ